MSNAAERSPLAVNIWLLAVGYFAFYIPYSALTKALSSNLLADYGLINTPEPTAVSAFLPIVLLGTIFTMPLIIFGLGWYRYLNVKRFGGWRLPELNRWAVFSGLAFAVIIATTTIAYSFQGVSIVFALLLMRGGVIVLSPIIDSFLQRKIHWYSGVGCGISLLAVGIALTAVNEYSLTFAVLTNLLAYLTGYLFRLRLMTQCAKDAQETLNRRFFVQENIVAMLTLLCIAIGTIAWHLIDHSTSLSSYISTMAVTGVAWPALLIGALYSCLGVFGSLIYLNRRENTFAIPVNRSASLLSGVVATLLLVALFEKQDLSFTQLSSALLMICAVMLMSFFDLRQIRRHCLTVHNPMQRIWLFVCDGNRMRSPMAAAICNKALVDYMDISGAGQAGGIYAESAALKLGENRSMPDHAYNTLSEYGIDTSDHRAQQLDARHICRAEKVFCMSDEQCQTLVQQFPWVTDKVSVLGDAGEIPKPNSSEKRDFVELAETLHRHIFALLRPRHGEEVTSA